MRTRHSFPCASVCKTERVLEIPTVVQNKALALGRADWLDSLPERIAELARDWGLALGPVFADATEALVVAATTHDGTPVVVKVLVPREGAYEHERAVLELVGGDGCVTLLGHDDQRRALVLERLGPSLHALEVPLLRRHEIMCATVQRFWRRPGEYSFTTGEEKARWLARFIVTTWEELDRPCSERVVEHALACASRRQREHDDERSVVVHGDVHQWNTLRGEDGFKLIDPDGLLAEPEYDLGVIMREDPEELVSEGPHARARWLARRTGLDAHAIWEWGVVERVSTGLLATQVELQPVGAQMLRAAEYAATLSDGDL